MNKKMIKVFILILGLLFSPLVLAVVAGLLFIFGKLLIGSNLSGAIQALKAIINSVTPFLPYITILPVVTILLVVTIKNKDRLNNRFKNY